MSEELYKLFPTIRSICQAVTEPDNQPHQWTGSPDELYMYILQGLARDLVQLSIMSSPFAHQSGKYKIDEEIVEESIRNQEEQNAVLSED